MAVSFLAVSALLASSMPTIAQEMRDLVRTAVQAAFSTETTEVLAAQLLLSAVITMGKVCGPILGLALVLGFVMNVAQVGFIFTTKPLIPNLNKLNPINGLKGMFNMKKIVELIKTLAKFIIVSWLAWNALKSAMRDIGLIIRSDLMTGVKVVGTIIWDVTTRIGGVFLAIAAFDYFYQRKRYFKENMMSKYDIKQEYKQSEGDPHHKAERKRMHQEILHSSGSNVKKADVVVRNPDHIAVALRYNKEGGGAPEVVAKGTRIWAEKILDAARRYGVPVVRNVPLAHALDKLEVGDQIPEELYDAVAEVLNFVYQLTQEQKNKTQAKTRKA